MELNPDNQGDEPSYHEQTYFESLNGSLQDADVDYQPGDLEQRSPLREQDRFLPIANVAKIMKRAVPNNGKIAKDAKECVQECVSEFISFITSEAAERCQAEKRKTINGEDILCAMNALGFDNYVEPLKTFLVKYREISKLESTYLDDSTTSAGPVTIVSPSTIAPASGSFASPTPGSTVILTPTSLLTANAAAASLNPTVSSNSPTVVCNRSQLTLVNGSAAPATATAVVSSGGDGATELTGHTSTTGIKLPTGTTMATLGAGLPSSLGTAIILPISTQLTIVNGAATTTVSNSDPSSTNNAS